MSGNVTVQRRPFGSWLLGAADQRLGVLRIRVRVLLIVLLWVANFIGAAVVFVLAVFALPGPPLNDRTQTVVFIATPIYVVIAQFVGCTWGMAHTRRTLRWLFEERRATVAEQRATLRVPLTLTLIEGLLWGIGAVLFTGLAGVLQPDQAQKVAMTTIFGGLVTCANSYLLVEFTLRPVAARAMTDEPPRRVLAAGLETRTIVFWLLGSAVPIIGLMLTGLTAWTDDGVTVTRLAISILAIGAVTLVFGLAMTVKLAKATVAPVRSVRHGLSQVQRGDFDVHIPVFDGTELGSLQAGFNRMAAGLRERERIRDLFGRYVGREVVEDALARSVALGGEERYVAVVFVDLVGSTGLAASKPPGEVVAVLNRFFEIVVVEVERHGGFVNKFAGDAVLAVFGAPHEQPDPARRALAAARGIRNRLDGADIEAGIGVAAGTVVAGTIGDQRRYEYTVIGDPVNEAARLTELAKSVPGRTLASMTAVRDAGRTEAEHWQPGDDVVLRGRTAATQLARPTDRGPVLA